MLFNIVLSKLYGVNKLLHQTIYCVIDHTQVLSHIHTFSNTLPTSCIIRGWLYFDRAICLPQTRPRILYFPLLAQEKNKLHNSSLNFHVNLAKPVQIPAFVSPEPSFSPPSFTFLPQVNSFLSERSFPGIFFTNVAEFHQQHTVWRTAPADFIFFVTLCFYNWGQTHAAHPVCWKPFVPQTSYISCGAF